MKQNHTKAIIVFVRFPVAGKVKTRLASEIGNKLACSFYTACAEYVFAELRKLKGHNYDIFLFGSDKTELEKIIKWTEDSFYYSHQEGNDLGERMYNAFAEIFHKNYKQVIIVGTDLPGLNAKIIQLAFSSLDNNECVIGPANDGGYYLLGFRDRVINLFEGMTWSTISVFTETIEKIKLHKATYSALEGLIDIDIKEELIKWYSENRTSIKHPVIKFIESHKSELL